MKKIVKGSGENNKTKKISTRLSPIQPLGKGHGDRATLNAASRGTRRPSPGLGVPEMPVGRCQGRGRGEPLPEFTPYRQHRWKSLRPAGPLLMSGASDNWQLRRPRVRSQGQARKLGRPQLGLGHLSAGPAGSMMPCRALGLQYPTM